MLCLREALENVWHKNEVNGCKNCRGRRTQTLKWVEHVQHVPCVSTMQQAVSKRESGLSIKKPRTHFWVGTIAFYVGPPTFTNSEAAAADMSKQNGPHVGVTNVCISIWDWNIHTSSSLISSCTIINLFINFNTLMFIILWNSTFVFKHLCIYRFCGSIKTLQKTRGLVLGISSHIGKSFAVQYMFLSVNF